MNGMQGKRTVWLGLLLAVLALPACQAVLFVSTGDPTFNTSAPTGSLTNSGWQYEGQWNDFLATPIAPRCFLAAKHVGGNVGGAFVLNGVTYHTVAFSDGPNTDLRIWVVAETFPGYAPLYTKTDEVGKRCVVFGRGTDRGPAITVKGAIRGWQWGNTNNIERWGENVIARVSTNAPVGQLLAADFDHHGVPNECDLSYNDSSGGVFIEDGTSWKLAGINYTVDGPFSLDGTANTKFDGALTDARGLYYMTITNTWALIPASFPIPVPTSFYSSRVSANISWINNVIDSVPPSELQVTSPPAATNALATIDNIAVVRPGDTIGFSVGAVSTNGSAVNCLWTFADGVTNTDCDPSRIFTTCGGYDASVTLSDSVMSVTTGLTVAAACPMTISSLKLQAKFTRVGADTCTFQGTLPNLATGFPVANASVTVDVGDAPVAFQLNARGQAANPNGNVKFSFNQKTATWTFTGKLKGNLHNAWATHGLTQEIALNTQVTVPVVLLLQSGTVEAFDAEPVLSYSNKSGTSGTATYIPPK
jgi:hypothetical protein